MHRHEGIIEALPLISRRDLPYDSEYVSEPEDESEEEVQEEARAVIEEQPEIQYPDSGSDYESESEFEHDGTTGMEPKKGSEPEPKHSSSGVDSEPDHNSVPTHTFGLLYLKQYRRVEGFGWRDRSEFVETLLAEVDLEEFTVKFIGKTTHHLLEANKRAKEFRKRRESLCCCHDRHW